jgi:hypothetical protein
MATVGGDVPGDDRNDFGVSTLSERCIYPGNEPGTQSSLRLGILVLATLKVKIVRKGLYCRVLLGKQVGNVFCYEISPHSVLIFAGLKPTEARHRLRSSAEQSTAVNLRQADAHIYPSIYPSTSEAVAA